jgi:hypothetical protein
MDPTRSYDNYLQSHSNYNYQLLLEFMTSSTAAVLKPATDSQTIGVRGAQLPTATDSGGYEVENILTIRGEAHQRLVIPDKMEEFPNTAPCTRTSTSTAVTHLFEDVASSFPESAPVPIIHTH